jgi:deoxyhypusine synthase
MTQHDPHKRHDNPHGPHEHGETAGGGGHHTGSGHHKPDVRPTEQLADGWSDGLLPLEPLDVMKAGTCDALLRQMSRTAFGGRNLGEAADVFYEMAHDPDCFIVLTLSGAMTIAKMGLLITEMIDQGLCHAIVSTGALMCHGLIEQTGHTHFRYDPTWSDERLYEAGYARVYDTLELEKNLDEADVIIREALAGVDVTKPFGSYEVNRAVGEHMRKHFQGRGILQSAAAKGVPVYVPAFTDSELGLDLFVYDFLRGKAGQPGVRLDLLRDLGDYLERCMKAKKLGILTIGGGTPRNWAQQVGPLAELAHRRTGGQLGGLIRFHYAVRICPEPTHWGGLSGCTYSEGVSWGKFVPASEGGRQAEVYADATIAWPIMIRGVLERLGRV